MNTNDNKKDFLPIGTVVLLKEASKRLMIIGYLPTVDKEKKEIYDYSGIIFPEGLINTEEFAVFNNDQIEYVYYYGLKDEEQQEFIKNLQNLINEQNEETKNIEDGIELPNLNSANELETLNIEGTN